MTESIFDKLKIPKKWLLARTNGRAWLDEARMCKRRVSRTPNVQSGLVITPTHQWETRRTPID